MKDFTEPAEELQAVEELKKRLQRGGGLFKLSGCIDADKAHLIRSIGGEEKSCLIVTHHEIRARELSQDLFFFDSGSSSRKWSVP